MTANSDNNPSPFALQPVEWEAEAKDLMKAAKPINQKREELLDIPPHVDADDLDGETFVIAAAKPFESSFEGQDHAYFVGCYNEDRGRFTTVLGGFILVETLDQLIEAGNKDPLLVTLKQKKQGKYGKYWVFE